MYALFLTCKYMYNVFVHVIFFNLAMKISLPVNIYFIPFLMDRNMLHVLNDHTCICIDKLVINFVLEDDGRTSSIFVETIV